MSRKNAYDDLDDKPAKASAGPRRRRASFFGFLSAIVGLAAIAVTQRERLGQYPYGGYLYEVQNYKVDPYQVAAIGCGLAAWALLWRSILGRTKAGWPILGLLLCGAAAGTWRYQNSPKDPGSPEAWVRDNVVVKVQTWIDEKMAPAPAPKPATVETSIPLPTTAPSIEITPVTPTPAPVKPAPSTQPKEPASKLFPEL